MACRSYRDLNVWIRSFDLAVQVYRESRDFPRDEIYGLRSQLRRAAYSISLNLAEGHERESTKEFLRFILIARGSLAETETLLLLSRELGYLTANQVRPLMLGTDEIGKMIRGLQRSLQRKL